MTEVSITVNISVDLSDPASVEAAIAQIRALERMVSPEIDREKKRRLRRQPCDICKDGKTYGNLGIHMKSRHPQQHTYSEKTLLRHPELREPRTEGPTGLPWCDVCQIEVMDKKHHEETVEHRMKANGGRILPRN